MNSLDSFYKWIESNGHKPDDSNQDCIENFYMRYIQEKTITLIDTYKSELPKTIKQNNNEHRDFIRNHITHWGDALNLLELLIDICIRSGSDFSEFREINKNIAEENKTGLLIRLHAKACSISNEILLLLKNGFADGAHARWRSLHEINVTLHFINSNSPVCAERFLAHEIYDGYYGMKSHKKYEHRLQEKGPSAQECAIITQKFKDALNKYGSNFDSQYGWAVPFLPQDNGKTGFGSLEKAVNLDHMRPYFKWASQNIHPNTKTITKSLSLPAFEPNIIIAGPSNFGLTDPAQAAAISLSQATSIILMINQSESNIIKINSLSMISQEVGRKFLETTRKFEK